MAKTAKFKKSTKPTSLHSRAAKRASSPSIDIDKSLKQIKAPVGSANGRASVLSVHNGAGIIKRKGKGKALSRHQRLRQERGIQRAEAVMDKTEKRVEKNNVKVKTVKERSAAWDELNNKIQDKKLKLQKKTNPEEDWEDEEKEVELDKVVPTKMSQPMISATKSSSPPNALAGTDPPEERMQSFEG